ncbi:HISTONE H1 [Salix koriyanagi]|uniref:HISTONE H1 n=1 Tax=Salix koriyanagi TaxID=2511006 RepID=A0A9Q0SME9_9ROSI|nr:HISTONE H1 [Salix koriyanagi]
MSCKALESFLPSASFTEAEAPVAEQPLATEEPKVEEKPVKEKKPRTPREKKPRQPKPKTVAHPPYFQMIKEAILALNEKSGSSPYAIAKYMEGKHKAVLPANFKKILGHQLKNSAARGKLIKIRASFKLSAAGKKEKSTAGKVSNGRSAVKKTEEAKTSMRNTRSVNKADASAKKVGAKKAKKSAAAKPKQPKSIKSPSVKRAKKVTATA